PPYSFRASEAGLKDMGTATKAIGAYQSDGAFVMREWAKANSDALVRYISAYVEGRRWAFDPANKAEAIALLSERLKPTPQVAALAYAVATDPPEGMAKDAKFHMAGFANGSSCAPRSKDSGAANRPLRRGTSIYPITTGRYRACGNQGRLHRLGIRRRRAARADARARPSAARRAVAHLQRGELAADGEVVVIEHQRPRDAVLVDLEPNRIDRQLVVPRRLVEIAHRYRPSFERGQRRLARCGIGRHPLVGGDRGADHGERVVDFLALLRS